MPVHAGSGRTISDVLDYVENPEKTRNGELICSYKCDSRSADGDFDLSKRQYKQLTGRSQGGKDIIAYHTRQSFRPGEVTPEEAMQIGYELAMRFTKGNHAFVVCTHVDRAHVHNHIIFNSTSLDCRKKFRNFLGSSFALRRVSDHICVEHGLSIVKNPKPSRGHYGTWLGEDRPLSFQEELRRAIDDALESKPADFNVFLSAMESAGYEIRQRGKYLSFRKPGQKNFTRCKEKTLGADYTEDSIRERISGERIVERSDHRERASSAGHRSSVEVRTPPKLNLIIDIQQKLQAGKGIGYERWAKVHNLKQMAKTLIYLQENNLTDYDVLAEKTSAASERFHSLANRLKELETALSDNAALQKNIVNYSKTRQTYTDYRKAGYSKKFRAEHESDIILHQAAKKSFDDLGYGKDKKLPTVKTLREEYAVQLAEKKAVYKEYREAQAAMRELLTVKANADIILEVPTHERERERDNQRM